MSDSVSSAASKATSITDDSGVMYIFFSILCIPHYFMTFCLLMM